MARKRGPQFDPEAVRAWLDELYETTGLTPTAVARKAGLVATTLTRVRNPAWRGSLSAATLQRIADAHSFALPAELGGIGIDVPQDDRERVIYAADVLLELLRVAPTRSRRARAQKIVEAAAAELLRL